MIPTVSDISMAVTNTRTSVFHPNSLNTRIDTGKHGIERAIMDVAMVASRALKGRFNSTIGAAYR